MKYFYMIKKMNIIRNLNLKEYIWNSVHKLTNSFSILTVNNLGNGYIKCIWEISRIDNLRIELSNSCFYAIRLFDISNNCLLYTSPSPRDGLLSRMPSSA